MAKLTVDLHDCCRDGYRIESALTGIVEKACERRISTVEIIHGKGSGQLKKRVLKFLERPEIKSKYHRVDKDSKNHGRLFVYFRH